MKKLKYLVLILMIFLFSGCSGSYNLTFNKDLTVEEKLDVLIENKENYYEKTIQMFEKAEIDESEYNVKVIDEKVSVVYEHKYRSFSDYYLNSKLYKTLFEDIEFKKDKTGMKINTESYFKLNDNENEDIINSYDIEDLKINIKMPFYMNKSNEDSKQNDIYTWEINKNDTKKEINMDFSYKKASTLSIVLIVLLVGAFVAFIIFIIRNLLRSNKI